MTGGLDLSDWGLTECDCGRWYAPGLYGPDKERTECRTCEVERQLEERGDR